MNLDPRQYLKYSKLQMGIAAELIEQIGLRGDEKLLDIGCGDGKITALLHEMAEEATGLDASEHMVAFATHIFPHIKFIKQDAEEITFTNQFDILTCLSAIHWMRDPGKAMKKMHQALKKGGKAYILTYPEESVYWGPLETTANEAIFAPYRTTAVNAYSTKQYLQMAKEAGFELISTESSNRFATHENLEEAKSYINSWLPSYIQLPENLRAPFLDLAARREAAQAVDRGDGKLHLPYTKLVMILQKP